MSLHVMGSQPSQLQRGRIHAHELHVARAPFSGMRPWEGSSSAETGWRQVEGVLSKGGCRRGESAGSRPCPEGPHGLWAHVRGSQRTQRELARLWGVSHMGGAEDKGRCRKWLPDR